MLRRALIAIWSVWLTVVPALAAQPPSPERQNEYLPIDQLPPQETLPAGPLLVGAYIVVWMALMAYLWSIWRRLGRVEAEIQALQRRPSGSAH